MTIITDLPEDILAIIFLFLDSHSFLRLCRTCKDLYQYRQDSAYWRTITSTTFRLPISPLLKADGARWYWLYKRLRTQTKLYTWGQGVKGNLGPGRSLPPRMVRGRTLPPLLQRPTAVSFQRTSSSWPTEVHVPEEVGIIADLQCGGWSTSILSSRGRLYTVGLIDSLDGRIVGEPANEFRRLEYVTQSTSAIRQFSSGRRHVLALTDDGEILSWDRVNAKGLKVFSQNGREFGGKATRVAAGWGESSAYVPETGIVYWSPIQNDQQDEMLDGLHVKEKVIPGTARHTSKKHVSVEVLTHVVLESWIVWLTNEGKLFACDVHTDNQDQEHPSFLQFEVPGYSSSTRNLKDVQGQFNKFAVFTDTGEVLAGNIDYLRRCAQKAQSHPSSSDPSVSLPPTEWSGVDELVASKPADVPALQHNQVISLAFGDHHYHALHIHGKITSYGNDSQSCGSLGLGDMQTGGGFRGLRKNAGFRPDSNLLPQAERRGREVWFEPEKRDWLKYLAEEIKHGHVSDLGQDFWGANNTQKHFMLSEWIEQEGRQWQDGPSTARTLSSSLSETTLDEEDFHLDPYFALAVSASGWHSGALVLVDEEKANTIREKWITKSAQTQNDHEHETETRTMPGHFESGPEDPEETYIWKLEGFPRVKLPDGSELPGQGEARRWRYGMPLMTDFGLQ